MKNSFFILVIALLISSNTSCLFGKRSYKFNSKDPKIALVISGSLSESSWNKAAYIGLKRFQQDNKTVSLTVVERVGLNDAKSVFTQLGRKHYDLIIAHSYGYSEVVAEIAERFPKTFFCVVGGGIAEEANLCSFNFKDEQYGYLVGVVAGLTTTTNKIGIVVGKKLPSIERSIVGIRKGLKVVNPKADLVVSYIDSWNDISKGRQAAIDQINTGVDTITHLADIAGIGVIKAAEEADISAIGAIEDQHDLAPSTVVCSGIQDASQLIYIICQKYLEQTLKPMVYSYGLKDQVIDLSPTYGNVDPTTETRVNKYKSELVNVEVKQEEHEKNILKKN